jgi:hypothetical protein
MLNDHTENHVPEASSNSPAVMYSISQQNRPKCYTDYNNTVERILVTVSTYSQLAILKVNTLDATKKRYEIRASVIVF